MATIVSRPNLLSSLDKMVRNIATSIQNKFYKFYLRRIIEAGLAVKTYNNNFEIGYEGSAPHRRSISKLKQLLLKYLHKVNPFVAFSNVNFMDTNSSDGIKLDLIETDFLTEVPEYCPIKLERIFKERNPTSTRHLDFKAMKLAQLIPSSTSVLKAFSEASTEFKSLVRYTRYLNYIFRKNNIPIVAEEILETAMAGADSTSGLKFKLSLHFYFRRWVSNNPDVINKYKEVQSGKTDDKLFENIKDESTLESRWFNVKLTDSVRDPIFKKYDISNVFLNLENGLKILTTVTRKMDYGYAAFDFRTQ
jgi:hypothetical protein